MIGGFVRAHLESLTEADLDALEAVMEMPDTDLAEWLTGREPIPPTGGNADAPPHAGLYAESLAR